MFPSLYSGTISQDCIDAVGVNPQNLTKMNQTVIEGSVQGGLFNLPAGELRFAAGAGWRKNTFAFVPADILTRGVGCRRCGRIPAHLGQRQQ